ARLAGASTATAATTFAGRYVFDAIDLRDGAALSSVDPIDGGVVTLSGDVGLPSPLEVTDLTVVAGAVLRTTESGPWLITASGTLTLAAGGTIDVDGGGYVGGSGSSWSPGEAPAWVTAAPYSAGGSYGGVGSNGHEYDNGVGDTYDSVYQPSLGGAGGSTRYASHVGGTGGGALIIDAATLVLDGTITARGASRSPIVHSSQNLASGGAGGAVSIVVGHLSGTGSIDVRGGDYQGNHNTNHDGAGGGGRVAIDMATGSFDVTTQVLASGGRAWNNGSELLKVAGAGTVLVRQGVETYGALYMNAGVTDGTPVPMTPLPLLGGGSVTAVEVSGSDLWVTTVETLHPRWLGVVMTLSDGGGVVLGDFRVVELDGGGRARLAGASTATAATMFTGRYVFDAIDLRDGAALSSVDPLDGGAVTLSGEAGLPSSLDATSVTVASGGVVTPATGDTIEIDASGTVTIESGARIDASAFGYPGGFGSSYADGMAPNWVSASPYSAGGSHGGAGSSGHEHQNPAGATYDSVYRPSLAGASGSTRYSGNEAGNGGGVIVIEAASVVLQGELWAHGGTRDRRTYGNHHLASGGAGGSIRIVAGTLSGAGLIDVRGGDYLSHHASQHAGVGGGGRVALEVDDLSAFDLTTQVEARGGRAWNNSDVVLKAAGPGTVYSLESTDVFGHLRVDGGAPGVTVVTTPLPVLGSGTVGTIEVDATDAQDLWIEPQDGSALFIGAPGARIRIGGVDYTVLEVRADRRRVLLDGAAGVVTVGASYEGLYVFDSVTVRGDATLEFFDIRSVTTWVVESGSTVVPAP
ncbi:MAG: hypothetical protein AAGD38_18730, partial [Acidobacteriota bacterium]